MGCPAANQKKNKTKKGDSFIKTNHPLFINISTVLPQFSIMLYNLGTALFTVLKC